MVNFSCYEEQIFETRFAISDYFNDHPGTTKFPAKDLMPYLEQKKIFKKTQGEIGFKKTLRNWVLELLFRK